MYNSIKLLAAASAIAFAVPAIAQDLNGEPNYGTVELTSGFSDDPYVVSMQSGGVIDASALGNPCTGYITEAPDVRLIYEASATYPLIISVNSGADTTLVVNAPDGQWYCDDDTGTTGLNPMVRFNNPMTGRYEIWAGTYGSASLAPAELNISEVYSQ